MTLRAGNLSGQDLGLLTERSVLRHELGHLCLFVAAAEYLEARVIADGALFPDSVDAFSYIGELQPDGFISAPEGGWESNPVPGRWIWARFRDCFGDIVEGQDSSDWYTWGQQGNDTIIAFRLAGEAVSIPPVDAGEVGKAVERLKVLHDQALNGTFVSDPDPYQADELGEIITVLAALSGSQGSNPKTDLPTEGGLLPCPFCGHREVEVRVVSVEDEGFRSQAECTRCGAMGPPSVYGQVDVWNRRAPQPTEEPSPPVVGTSPLEVAYGCLWRTVTDDKSLHGARQYIANIIGGAGKARGVQWACANLPAVGEAEIRSIEI